MTNEIAVAPSVPRVKRVPLTPVQVCDRTEQELRTKWGSQVEIVEDSCMPADEFPEFAGKMTVEVVCCDCEETRRIATQDVFQVRRCKACTKAFQKANKRAKRAVSEAGQAAAERVATMKAAKAKKDAAKRADQLAKLEAKRVRLLG